MSHNSLIYNNLRYKLLAQSIRCLECSGRFSQVSDPTVSQWFGADSRAISTDILHFLARVPVIHAQAAVTAASLISDTELPNYS